MGPLLFIACHSLRFQRLAMGNTDLFFCLIPLTRIMQLVSLPKMQGKGHADVLVYFNYPTTQQIR